MKSLILTSQSKLCVIISLILAPILGFSQGNSAKFLEISDLGSLNLTDKEQSKIQNFKKDKRILDVFGLKIGKLSKMAHSENGSLLIKLPGEDQARVCFPISVRYYSDNKFYWAGDFKKESGSISITCEDGMVFGRISIPHHLFEIQSFEDGKSYLIEHDPNRIIGDTDPDAIIYPLPNPESKLKSEPSQLKGLNWIPPENITVLLYYTSNALAFFNGSLSLMTSDFINDINYALENSLDENFISVSVVRTRAFYVNESTNIGVDHAYFKATASVQANREDAGADVVVLLRHTHPNDNSLIGGHSDIWQGNTSQAYALVNVDYFAVGSHIHEFGHLVGCKQSRGSSDTGYNWGYQFWTPDWDTVRTIMLQRSTYSTRITRFSNPNKTWDNYCPMGVANQKDNARWITENAATVADHRYDPNSRVEISGPSHGMINVLYGWDAYVWGPTPSSYTWYSSSNGWNYSQVGTGSYYETNLPSNLCLLFLKVVVERANLDPLVDFFTVTIDQPLPVSNQIRNPNSISSGQFLDIASTGQSSPNSITIFPNPGHESVLVEFTVIQPLPVDIKLTDLTGRVCLSSREGIIDPGSYSKRLNTSTLLPGVYLCTVQVGEKSIHKKMLIE